MKKVEGLIGPPFVSPIFQEMPGLSKAKVFPWDERSSRQGTGKVGSFWFRSVVDKFLLPCNQCMHACMHSAAAANPLRTTSDPAQGLQYPFPPFFFFFSISHHLSYIPIHLLPCLQNLPQIRIPPPSSKPNSIPIPHLKNPAPPPTIPEDLLDPDHGRAEPIRFGRAPGRSRTSRRR